MRPPPSRVAVHVRPARRPARRARRRAESARAHVLPGQRQRGQHGASPSQASASPASTSQSTRSDASAVRCRCRCRPCARSRGRPPRRGHDPERVLAAVRLARLVDAEEGDVLSVGRPRDARCTSPPAAPARPALRRAPATTWTAGAGVEVGSLAAIGAERDAFPVGRPGEALDRPVAARQAPRARTGARVLDEEVRVPVEVAVAVVPPVDARDHARQRRGARRQRADGEARSGRPTASASRLPSRRTARRR